MGAETGPGTGRKEERRGSGTGGGCPICGSDKGHAGRRRTLPGTTPGPVRGGGAAQQRILAGGIKQHHASDSFPPLEPTEMAQMEERVTKAKEEAVAAASHPPKLSERRTWLVWDLETGEYSDTGVAATSVMEVPVTLAASGWTGSGPWEQVVSVPGLTEHGEIGPANSLTEEQRAAVRNAMLSVSGKDMTSETLTVVADGEKPALDIPAIVFLWG